MADLMLLISDMMKGELDVPNQLIIMTSEEDMLRSLIRVIFTGKFRDIDLDPGQYAFIQLWSQTLDPGFSDLFQHEVLVTESGVDYWLPIQESLIPSMKAEVEVGSEMDVFIKFIGGNVLPEEKLEYVFVLNEFRIVIPPLYDRVTYTGKFRELDPALKNLIQEWSTVFMPLIDVQQEVLVTTNGVDYWCPVPESLVPSLKNEVDVGDEIWVLAFPIPISPEISGEENETILFLIREFSPVGSP